MLLVMCIIAFRFPLLRPRAIKKCNWKSGSTEEKIAWPSLILLNLLVTFLRISWKILRCQQKNFRLENLFDFSFLSLAKMVNHHQITHLFSFFSLFTLLCFAWLGFIRPASDEFFSIAWEMNLIRLKFVFWLDSFIR